MNQNQREPASETPDTMNHEGPEIPGYQVQALIGRGGMGAVYLAWQKRLHRRVAIKVLPPHAIADEDAVSRFDREMAAVGQLNHPNIVTAHDASDHQGLHYLVMEYVDGAPASGVVRRHGPLGVPDACEITRQAAEGLQHAHENGLVHRDIKPSNLMLSTDGTVKLLDLGLARLTSHARVDASDLTQTNQIVGTVDYMAPEQAEAKQTVDIRADIYSLGATLFNLLTGEVLFGGPEYDSIIRKLSALANETVRPIQMVSPNVPTELAAIIQRMLSREPEQRYSEPREVAAAVAPFCSGADLVSLMHDWQPAPIDVGTPTTEFDSRSQAGTAKDRGLSVDLSPTATRRSSDSETQTDIAHRTAAASSPRSLPVVIAAGIAVVLVIAGLVWNAVRYSNSPVGTDLHVDRAQPSQPPGPDADMGTTSSRLAPGPGALKTEALITPSPAADVQTTDSLATGGLASGLDRPPPRFALEFDELDDWMRTEFEHLLRQPLTIELWLKPDVAPPLDTGEGGYEGHGFLVDYQSVHLLRFETTKVNGVIGPRLEYKFDLNGPDSPKLTTPDPVALHRWSHVATVYDGKVVRLFVNGRQVASAVSPRPPGRGKGEKFSIGGRGDRRAVLGEIREVHVSSTARYDDDFQPALWQEPDADTIALFHCNEGDGRRLYDASPHKYEAKLSGVGWVKLGPAELDEMRRAINRSADN